MIRVLVVAAGAGFALACAVLWSVRAEVAYAEQPPGQPEGGWVAEAVAACIGNLGLAEVTTQGGVARVACRPGLGVAPVARGGR